MQTIRKIFITCSICYMLLLFNACQQPGGNNSGSEFMPDMAHSIAYEANYYNYYYNNTWGGKDEYYKMAKPRLPVKGTIPRGYAGVHFSDSEDAKAEAMGRLTGKSSQGGIAHTPSGAVPYYYGNTEEERTRATTEIIDNPYPITDDGLARAKELYIVNCGICHGDKGDGLGYLVRDPSPGDDGGKYPVQPANFLLEEFVNASNGRYYHSIMFGKNMMGAYADKLSYEERWQVIHYIRSLQAKELKLTYNQLENTLNAVDRPAGETEKEIAAISLGENKTDNSHSSGESH